MRAFTPARHTAYSCIGYAALGPTAPTMASDKKVA